MNIIIITREFQVRSPRRENYVRRASKKLRRDQRKLRHHVKLTISFKDLFFPGIKNSIGDPFARGLTCLKMALICILRAEE